MSLVTEELAVKEVRERHDLQWFPVVHVSERSHEVKQFTFFITDEVELEAPTQPMEHFSRWAMPLMPCGCVTLVLTHTHRRAVHETDTCTFSPETLF